MSTMAASPAAASSAAGSQQQGSPAPAQQGGGEGNAGRAAIEQAAGAWRARPQQTNEPAAPAQPAPAQEPAAVESYDDDEHQPAFEAPSEGGEQAPAEAAAEPDAAKALAAVEAMFGLKPGQATPNLMSGMMSDVEAYRAAQGAPSQPAAASPPAEPANPARPPSPASVPATSPAPVPQPQAAQDKGSGDGLAPLTDKQLSDLAEFDPALAAVGQAVNRVISQLSQQAAPPQVVAQLQAQVQAMQAEHQWTQVQPVVQNFVNDMVKQGLPALPPEQLREFAEEAGGYLDWKLKAGHKVTPQQAMQAIYLARTGPQLQAKAASAHAEGRQSVIKGLEKRQRSFVLAGQPGAVAPSQKAPDPKTAITQLANQYRRGQAQS